MNGISQIFLETDNLLKISRTEKGLHPDPAPDPELVVKFRFRIWQNRLGPITGFGYPTLLYSKATRTIIKQCCHHSENQPESIQSSMEYRQLE